MICIDEKNQLKLMKIFDQIDSNESDRVNSFNNEQFLKEALSIFVKKEGIFTSMRRMHSSKYDFSIVFTVDGIKTFSRRFITFINGGKIILLNEVHLEKPNPSIEATESGIMALTKERHFENAN